MFKHYHTWDYYIAIYLSRFSMEPTRILLYIHP